MRIRLLKAAVVFAIVLTCAAAGHAATYQIRADAAPGEPNTYRTLEEFLDNVVNVGLIRDGDVIELYNDDNSLTTPLALPYDTNLTFRSVGGQHSISREIIFNANSPDKTLVLENIRLSGTPAAGVSGDASSIVLKNCVIEDYAQPGLSRTGNSHTTITLDDSAETYTRWSSDKRDTTFISDTTITVANRGSEEDGIGTAHLDFDIAGGKTMVIDGLIVSTNQKASTSTYTGLTETTIVKTGDGVLKLNSGVLYAPNIDTANGGTEDKGYNFLDIQEGTVHFGDQFLWAGGTSLANGEIHVGKNGTFKPSITVGDLEQHLGQTGNAVINADWTVLYLDRFTSDLGARLEVGGISAMPFIGTNQIGNTVTTLKAQYEIALLTDPAGSNVAPTMHINNQLMEAYLEQAELQSGDAGLLLRIERVENLSTLDGVGGYADVYRRMTDLSEAERDMLDAVYATGGSAGLGVIQTIGGQIVQNSLLALRHNQANLLAKINSRLTKYQKEELLLEPEVTGSEFLYYQDEDPILRYGELWANIDQTWMTQRDTGDMAGYRYNAASLSIGYDRHWDNIIAGGVLNYAFGSMKLRNHTATRTDLDTFMAAAYASWAQDGWYVSGTVFAAYGWNESDSAYGLGGLASVAKTGTYATSSYGANAEFGYMMETDLVGIPLRVTPHGGLTYARMHRDAVRERGAGNLDRQFRAGALSAWDAEIGVRVAVPMEGDGYTLVPSIDLAVTRTMGSPDASGGDAYFTRNPAKPWNIPFMSDSRNSVRLAAGLDARLRNNVTVAAGYELEWRNQFWKNQFNLAASVEF